MSETRLKIEADHEDDDDGNEINKSLESSKRLKIRRKENDGDKKKQWGLSDLSADLIYSIMERLDYMDLIRCCAVCKDWSAIANQLKPRQGLPWLVEFSVTSSPKRNLGTLGFYNLSNGEEYKSCFYPILDPSRLSKHCSFKFYASKHGWIFFMVRNYRHRPCEFFCYNPFSRKKIKFPCLTIKSEEAKGAISANPTSSDSMVFLLDSFPLSTGGSIMKIMTYKYGDATWDKSYKCNMRVSAIHDVVYCNGFLYCAIENGLLGAFDIANQNWNMIQTIYPSQPLRNISALRSKLLISNEELLMVAFYSTENSYCDKDVYWLDHSNMKWVRIEERLDDNRAFFVDPFGYSISTTEEANSCQLEGSHIKNFGHERIFRPHKSAWPDGTFRSFYLTGYTFQILVDAS